MASLRYSSSRTVLAYKLSNENLIRLRFFSKSNTNLSFSSVPKLINENEDKYHNRCLGYNVSYILVQLVCIHVRLYKRHLF